MRGKPQMVIAGCALSAIASSGRIVAGGLPADCTHPRFPDPVPYEAGDDELFVAIGDPDGINGA